ncbi:MAG: FAD-dependent monooxygenase, partial [Clostridia bacterium]|nr:FAD-dependent monooxygenase [Clostridia bacterium]
MEYDVLIIGAATSGAYFAQKMAKRGYKVKMLEKLSAEKTGTRMDIFHVSRTDLKTFEMPSVKQGDKAWAFEFTDNHFSSPSNKYKVYTAAETVGLHMHEYVSLMIEKAVEAGAEIEFSAAFKEFIIKDGVICGVRYETADGMREAYSRTVIDCSGSAAVARRALPSWYGVETFSLADDEMFYVILRYAEFDKPQINNFWLNTKSWFAPFSMDDKQKIMGTGAVKAH